MKPKWQKLASLAQEICTFWFQFFGAVFASKGYPFKNIFVYREFYENCMICLYASTTNFLEIWVKSQFR